jgi:hypothetical protein
VTGQMGLIAVCAELAIVQPRHRIPDLRGLAIGGRHIPAAESDPSLIPMTRSRCRERGGPGRSDARPFGSCGEGFPTTGGRTCAHPVGKTAA